MKRALTFVLVLQLIQCCYNVETEWGLDLNPDDDVHLVYINNYTTVIHIKMKWITFVFEKGYSTYEGSDYSNYSKVAKVFKESLFFTRLNGTLMSNIVEDFLTKVPSIIAFANKTAYVYKGGYSYEEIYEYVEQFSKPDWKPDPTEITFLNGSDFDSIFPKIKYGVFIMTGDEDEKTDMLYVGRLKTVAEKLKNENIPVIVVNNKTDPEISKKLNVDRVNSLKLIRNGKLYPFKQDAQHHISYLVKYVRESNNFGSHLITEYKAGIYTIKKQYDIDMGVFVAVLASNKSSWYSVFEETVNSLRDTFTFFHTFDRETGKKFGCKQLNCLITIYPERLASPYDNERLEKYTLSNENLTKLEMVKEYIHQTSRPLVGHLSNRVTVSEIYSHLFPKFILYMDLDFIGYGFKENQYYIKQLWEIAREFKNFTFVFSNREDFESSLKEKKIYDSGNEVDLVIEDLHGYYYLMRGGFNYKNARNFVISYIAGTIRPVLKSADIPKIQRGNDRIINIVAKNFDDIVMSNDNDMIIFFYAGWCRACKDYRHVFVEASNKFKGNDKLVFAQFECENNIPPPEYYVDSFPTLYFGQANSKRNPIKYIKKGEGDFNELINFIKSHLTISKPRTDDL